MQTHALLDKRFAGYVLLLTLSTVAWSFALVALPFQALGLPRGHQTLVLAVALGTLPRLLAPLLAPWLRSGLRSINAVAAALAALVILRTACRTEPAWIQFSYLLLGTNAVLDGITPSLLVRAWFPEETRMRANALVGMVTLGVPVVAWPLAGHLSGSGSPIAVLGLAASGYLGKAVLAYAALPRRAVQPDEPLPAAGERPALPHYAPLLFIVVLAMVWLGYLQVAVPVMVEHLPAPGAVYGWYGGLFSLGMAAGAGTLFVVGNRAEPARALGLAGFFLPLGVVLYALPGIAALLAAGAVYGFGLGAVQTAGATYLQKVVPRPALARVLAWVTSAAAAASLAGAALAGLVLNRHARLALVVVVLQIVAAAFWGFGRGDARNAVQRGPGARPRPSKKRG